MLMWEIRELAIQISEQFEALGSTIGVKCVVIVGGMGIYPSIHLSIYPSIHLSIYPSILSDIDTDIDTASRFDPLTTMEWNRCHGTSDLAVEASAHCHRYTGPHRVSSREHEWLLAQEYQVSCAYLLAHIDHPH